MNLPSLFRRNFDTHPAVWNAGAIIVGILLFEAAAGWWLAAIMAAIGGVLLFFRRREGLLMLVASVGWLSSAVHAPNPAPAGWYGTEQTMAATVVEENIRSTGRLILDINSLNGHTFRAEALTDDFSQEYIDGQKVSLRGIVQPLRLVEDMPFPVGGDLAAARRGCVARVILSSAPEIVDDTPSWRARCQKTLEIALVDAGISDEALGLYCAILVGDDSMVDEHSLAHFRAVGIAHALALSGFHIGFIAMLAGALFDWLRIWPRMYGLRLLLIILVVWGYTAVTGMAMSTVRASVMATVLVLCRLRGQVQSDWNMLGVAVLVILAAAPQQLYSVGFLLSVSAVAGILAFKRAFNPIDPKKHLTYITVGTATVPVAAVLGTCAASVWIFHTAPLFFLPAGIFIAAFFPILMICGIVMMGLGALGIGGGIVATIGNAPVRILNCVADEIASWGGGDQSFFISAEGLICIIGIVLLGAVAVNVSRRKLALGSLAVAALLSVASFSTGPEYPEEEVYVVPLGNSIGIVTRYERDARAILTSQPRYRDAAELKLRRQAELFLKSRRCDSLLIEDEGFALGNIRRRGQYIFTGKVATSIPVGKHTPDSVPGGADYLLLTNQCQVKAADAFRRINPDTLVLAPVLSEKRRAGYAGEAHNQGVAVIDMRERAWTPVYR